MSACNPCGDKIKCCVKCLEPFKSSEIKEYVYNLNDPAIVEYISSLRERSRRTVNRKLEKKEIKWYF